MNKKELVGSICFIALFSSSFSISIRYEHFGVFPAIISGIGVLLSLFWFIRVLLKKYAVTGEALSANQIIHIVVAVIAAIAYIFGISIIGYLVSTIVFITLMTYYLEPKNKKYVYPLVAVAFAGVTYMGFKVLLGVPLPAGLLI